MTQSYTRGLPVTTDGTLSDNSDILVPSEKAVKTYVDTHTTGTPGPPGAVLALMAEEGDEGPMGPPGTPGNSSSSIGNYSVIGLRGLNNTSTPNTQMDFSADIVQLRNTSTGSIVVRTNTGTITNNVSTAGPAANGRDQSGAFSASSWIHFYFIWDGTTLATVSSATAPPTGPTLPTNYTHWAYIGAARFNASSQMLRQRQQGCRVYYEIDTGGVTRVLAAGAATTFTAISLTGFIPPNTIKIILRTAFALSNSTLSNFNLQLRPTGSSMSSGIDYVFLYVVVINTFHGGGYNIVEIPPGTTQQIDYKLTSAPTTGGAYIEVEGYSIPNGDAA